MKQSKWFKNGKRRPTISGWYKVKAGDDEEQFTEGKKAWRYYSVEQSQWFWDMYKVEHVFTKNVPVTPLKDLRPAAVSDYDKWAGLVD